MAKRRDLRRRSTSTQSRSLKLESLERRELLAAEVLAVRPDSGGLLNDGDRLSSPPSEFNIYFQGGSNLDESTITTDSVKLIRSGGDGTFQNGNDVEVALGYVGLVNPGSNDPLDLQRLVFRPASSTAFNAKDPTFAFPDDVYQIQILGSGTNPLRSLDGQAFDNGNDFRRLFRLDRGAQVISVVPQPISRDSFGAIELHQDQIDVYFDDQVLNDADVRDPKFYRLVNTSASATANDDETLLPISVDYDPDTDRARLFFESAIPEGTYRLDVGAPQPDSSLIENAIRIGSLSNGNDYSVNGYLGDTNGVSNDASDRDLYEVQLAAGSTLQLRLAPHADDLHVQLRILDAAENQVTASMGSTPGSEVTLSSLITTAGTYYIEVTPVTPSSGSPTGSYALTAGVTGNALSTSDNNSTVNTAINIGQLGAAPITISSQIQRQNIPLPPRPGSIDEPGHRQIQREQHIGATGTTPTIPSPIQTRRYYFPDTIGTDASGNPYLNLITEKEKQIVREIYEVYAQLSGYEFIESATGGGTSIGKGDLRALRPEIGPNDGVAGLGGPGAVVLNGAIFDQANRFFGDGFTSVMFHEIGHSLGLDHAYEIPANMGAGVPNDVLPGDNDIVHLQRIVPPNSTDIDMYRFDIVEAGTLKLETIAERLGTPSLLNTVIKVYRQVGGDVELIAQNDQYFGSDSYLELSVNAGTYFVGVSSTGNDDYDPRVPDSGYGGTTDGAYDLRIGFEAASQGGEFRDIDGTVLDGDADGRPGGVHSFWFQASDPSATIYVDKLNDTVPSVFDGDGSALDPFDNIQVALQQAGSRIVVPVDGQDSIVNGEQFTVDDGLRSVTFTFGTTGTNPIDISGAADADDVAIAIRDAVQQAVSLGQLSGSVGVALSGRVVQFSGIDTLDIGGSETLLETPNVIRIVGNGGADDNANTLGDNHAYLVGLDASGTPLEDGAEFLVPQGVTVMIEAGALLKLRKANIDAGTSAVTLSRSHSAIQVLGTPHESVFLRSYRDDTAGGDSNGAGPDAAAGDYGGIVFRGDSDLEDAGVFLNQVSHADIKHGGGKVFVDSRESVFTPVHIINARPGVSYNLIASSGDAAISATPDSFEESSNRIGPDIGGNFLVDNTIDGLFIRVLTPSGSTINKLTVAGRLDDTDITHVLTENLIIAGGAGGPYWNGSRLEARPAGRLMLDPGLVLKMNESRIEVERGAGALIAEGTVDRPVVFTSILDDRFGGSGAFDSDSTPSSVPQPGNWGGLYFGHATSGSIDNAIIAYGGGITPIEGGAADFNAIEVHQASLRLTNSLLDSNADGSASGQRNGRGANQPAVIYVRGSQPIIVDNTITNNGGAAISINANALGFQGRRDSGRSTGLVDAYDQFADNHGPLVRLNRLENNGINGMRIRGEELVTEGIWDDTDIVHVLFDEIVIDNHHTYSGLTLQSSNSESLVVKLSGANAGFTATGTPLEIIDRIGGTIHVLGSVGHPVILTHLSDDSVGAGYTPSGEVMYNTNNSGAPSLGVSGGWRGLRFDEFSNDRNVAVVREAENPLTNGKEINANPSVAQFLGELAPDQKSGDENRRLGFEVTGFISPDDPGDVDVYSFTGTAGTGVWIDIDRTDTALDAVVEVVNAVGTVLARSVRSGGFDPGNLNAQTLTQNTVLGGDHYTQNFRDPGLFYVLPGTPGEQGTYFIRVRSNPVSAGNITVLDGDSRGEYSMQIRLDQIQEFPGSTVRYADIRFAQTAIDARGLPSHSPLVGEAGELAANNDTFAASQTLVNLFETDVAALGISGELANENDVDWYQFDLEQTGVQVIGGVNDAAGTVAVVFDIDYADNAVRGDTTIAVFNEDQELIYVGRESNVADDQPSSPSGSIDDLGRGSLGKKDPYVGPIHLTPGGSYYVAVMSDRRLPSALTGVFQAAPANAQNTLVRLEPVNSVVRVVEDHIGEQGYVSGFRVMPTTPGGLFDISTGVVQSGAGVDAHVTPFTLQDVVLFVASDVAGNNNNDSLYTVDPFQSNNYVTRLTNSLISGGNDIQDIVIRSDGRMFGYQRLDNVGGSSGALVELDPTNIGTVISTQNDNIPGNSGVLNVTSLNANLGGASARAEEFTTSDEVNALTFQRTGTTGSADAPVPTYELYYAVDERDGAGNNFLPNTKLYRARDNGDATPLRAQNGDPKYGVLGDIQIADVTYASIILSVTDTANPANRTDIRIESKIPGIQGNQININISRPNNTNAAVDSVSGTTINLEIGLNNNNGPSAGAIVDAINNDPAARQLVTAVITGGNNNGNGNNGTAAVGLGLPVGANLLAGGSDGVLGGPIQGRVTGLSFGNFNSSGNLFGVTDAGEFLEIDPNSGNVVRRLNVRNVPGFGAIQFQGLALGPQNLEGGTYKDTVFAVGEAGELVAFDTTLVSGVTDGNDGAQVQSVMRMIFDGARNGTANSYSAQVSGMTGDAVGLAFSPLDFNLWHPTNKRGDDAGHGVNEAPDNTREAVAGQTSFHFGFEQWVRTPANTPSTIPDNAPVDAYVQYNGVNAQFGILTSAFQADLSSNPNIANTYNFPGGALGSLTTNSFSLSGTSRDDRPTLYFNYFLETENDGGSTVESDVNDPFRDSARVFISRNGGLTWNLLATNNSQLSDPDPTNGPGTAELPGFLSHLSDAGLNSGTPRARSQQIVQELHDNTDGWRQARVDLSDYAGASNVMLRVDFSTAGDMRNSAIGWENDTFGELTHDTRSIRSLNNAFEGFYLDDIIVGYAERGEMVTGANADSGITNLFAAGARTQDNDPEQRPDILNGPYQLEIRRTDEYIAQGDEMNSVALVFDTNDRHTQDPFTTTLLADRNRERAQGVFIIESNFIRDSSVVGINLGPGTTQAGGSVPHPGSTINFPQLNQDRLVPGAVVQNNVIVGSDGVRVAGESTVSPQRPVPFVRVVNNTIVGDNRSGVGIAVTGQASPTLMNNVLADLGTGISNGGTGTVIRSNFYQDNASNGAVGTAALIGGAGSPLFLDAANGNFILVSGSAAVDSSQNTEQDRLNYLTFKTELGIPASPIFAPDRDIYGQLRVDSDAAPGGAGSDVFKDRGATDRSDLEDPYAVLLNPIDNDSLGIDRDPRLTFIRSKDQLLENFMILLGDGSGPNAPFEGTGVDGLTVDNPNDPSVSQQAVTIEQDGVLLTEGVDYSLSYNELTGVLLLTPLSTLWAQGTPYTITLDNQQITDRVGNRLRPNQTDGTTSFTIISGVGPEAVGDVVSVDEDQSVLIDVLDNDKDIGTPLDPRTLVITGAPRNGVARVVNGEIEYVPNTDYFGPDSLTYRVTDEEGFVSNTATVTITVNPINDPPVGFDDPDMGTIRFLEDDPLQPVAIPWDLLLANDQPGPANETGQVLSIDSVLDLNGGPGTSVNIAISNDPINRVVLVTPQLDQNGIAQFTYLVRDDQANFNTALLPATVTIEFLPVNDAPVTDPSWHVARGYSVQEDPLELIPAAPLQIDVSEIEADDRPSPATALDELMQAVEVRGVVSTSEFDGTVTFNPTTGVIEYVPAANFFGTDYIYYSIADTLAGGGDPQSYVRNPDGSYSLIDNAKTSTGTIQVTVEPRNDPPEFASSTLEALEDELISYVDLVSLFGITGGPGESDPVLLSLQQDPSNGAAIFGFDGASQTYYLDYLPNPNFFGTDTLVLSLTDVPANGPAETVEMTVTLNVRPVNDAPVGFDDTINLIEGQPRTIPTSLLLGNDRVAGFGANGTPESSTAAGNRPQSLSVRSIGFAPGTPAGGSIQISADGNSVTIVPPPNYYTTDGSGNAVAPELVIVYELADDGISYGDPVNNQPSGPFLDSMTATATVTASVYPTNNSPVTTTHRITGLIEEDTPMSIPVSLLIPTDALVDSLPDGSAIPANYDSAGVGEDLGPNGIKDAGESLTQRLSIMSPVAGLSRISTTLGGSVEFRVNPATGKVEELFYTPPVDFASVPSSNLDSFNYRVMDDGKSFLLDANGNPVAIPNSQKASVGRVEIEVLPLNDRPQFNTSSLLVASQEDSGLNQVDNFAFNITAGPISAADEIDEITGQTVSFTLNPLSFAPVDAGQYFSQLPAITPDGDLSFTPAADAFGEFLFEVILVDNGPNDPSSGNFNSSIPVTMTINVAAVNDPPTFVAGGPVTLNEDSGPYSQGWASNISQGPANESTQTVDFEVVTPAESLSLFEPGRAPSITSDGVLRFTTAQDANGVALVEVTAVDSDGGRSQTVILQITVNEVNDPPLARPDNINTNEDLVLRIPVSQLLANDSDPDLVTNPNERLTLVMPEQSLSISGAFLTYDPMAGEITYDPTAANALQALAPGQSLVDSFSYSLVDASGAQSNVVTVALNVSGINDAPEVQLDTPTLNPSGPTIIRVLDNDRDVDGFIVPSTLQIELPPAFGSVDVRPDGTIAYTSFGGSAQEDVFTYTVADNLGLRSRSAFVTISTNASPIAVNDSKGTFLDEAVLVNVAANDSDPDGSLDLGSVVIVTPPMRGQAIPQSDGTVQYLPDPGFLGRDVFQYQISDNLGRASNVATVNVEVVASRLQNPDTNTDVNDDGSTSALDALLIVNHIARADGAASIPVLPTDRGPNFYDVNGNQQITANDALIVINELSRINNASGAAGEQVVLPSQDGGDVVAESSIVAVSASEDFSSADKILDASAAITPVSEDVLDLIASVRDQEDDEDNDALDAAFALLL